MSNTPQLKTFLDAIGRTIIGEAIESESNQNTLAIKNPALIHIVPNTSTGQIQLQILPLFFREFLADKDEGTVWYYNRATITESAEINYDFKLPAQYAQIFNPSPSIIVPQPNSEPPTIKLFDDGE